MDLANTLRRWSLLGPILLASSVTLLACGEDQPPREELAQRRAELVQVCTARNVGGNPYQGTLCGGAFIDNCTPGFLYTCSGGPRGSTNNCQFLQTCSTGCITGPNDTPVTANIGLATPLADDTCFTGPAPLSLATNQTMGGNYVTATATLTQRHTPYAVVNFQGTTTEVPPLCSPPLLLMPGDTQVSWSQPTGVVPATKTVPLWTLISFNDGDGAPRAIVSVERPLTLLPGGTLPAPQLASFDVTDASGAPITRIVGGTNAFTRGTLLAATPAPVGGLRVTVTSNPASAFDTDGSFTIQAGCTTNSTSGVLTATSTAVSDIAVTITGSASGASLSKNVVVTPPPLGIQSVTLTPSTVTGGSGVTATVRLNRAVSSSDTSSTVSLRLSEGLVSGAQIATFPGCTGSPACTGPVQVPVGAQTANVALSTSAVGTQDILTVAASASWSRNSASAQLTINPGGSCTPNCAGKTCGPDGCGGTCGTCAAGQTCNAAGSCESSGSATLTVTATGRSGERILSSPAGISVSVGSTGSASFATGMSLTLSASNSRDVIWSGACSSGGAKTKTCTFTLNANASVTGNVQ